MGPSSNTSGSIAAMRAVWPADRPMGVRHSVTDWAEGGWTLADAEVFAGELKKLGCDYITATTGGLSIDQKIPIGEGHQCLNRRKTL